MSKSGGQKVQQKQQTLRKHSALVGMSNTVTLTQRKAFNGMVYLAAAKMKEDPDAEIFTVPYRDFTALTGIETKDTQRLKHDIKEMVNTSVSFDILGRDNERKWKIMALIAEAELDLQRKTISFAFSPTIREQIVRPRLYARINMSAVRAITTRHALAIYELVKDYYGIGRTKRLPLTDFKQLMGLGSDEYSNFANLRKRVIDPAIEEINKRPEVEVKVDYELFSEGKKVVAIQFLVSEKSIEKVLMLSQINELDKLLQLLPEHLRIDEFRALLADYLDEKGFEYVESNIIYVLENAKDKSDGQKTYNYLSLSLAEDWGVSSRVKKKSIKITSEKKNKEKLATSIATEEENRDALLKNLKYLEYYNKLSDEQRNHIDMAIKQESTIIGPADVKIAYYLEHRMGIAL